MDIIVQVMGISDINLIIPDNQTVVYETIPQGVWQDICIPDLYAQESILRIVVMNKSNEQTSKSIVD